MKIHFCEEAKLDRFNIIKTFQEEANFKLDCPVNKVSMCRKPRYLEETE